MAKNDINQQNITLGGVCFKSITFVVKDTRPVLERRYMLTQNYLP